MLGWTFIHRNSNADPSLQAKNTRNTGTIFPILRFQMHFFFYSSCLTEEGQGSFAWIINKPEQHIQPTVCSLLQECVFLHTCYCYTPVVTKRSSILVGDGWQTGTFWQNDDCLSEVSARNAWFQDTSTCGGNSAGFLHESQHAAQCCGRWGRDAPHLSCVTRGGAGRHGSCGSGGAAVCLAIGRVDALTCPWVCSPPHQMLTCGRFTLLSGSHCFQGVCVCVCG